MLIEKYSKNQIYFDYLTKFDHDSIKKINEQPYVCLSYNMDIEKKNGCLYKISHNELYNFFKSLKNIIIKTPKKFNAL